MNNNLTFLCLSCEFKGLDLLRALKQEGNKVFLLTSENLRDEPWPMESIDDIFYAKAEKHCVWDLNEVAQGLSHLMRENHIDRLIALDDFDVEKAAFLREEFRISGMGLTTSRYFRDKLAMRLRAREASVPVPDFTALHNNDAINHFLNRTEAPWIIKPRGEAAAVGITKVNTIDQAWEHINGLGDKRKDFLIESFLPGDVFHVDSLIFEGKVIFTSVARYLNTPFEVAHGGGIFRSVTTPVDSNIRIALEDLNSRLLSSFGMKNGVSHTEFIQSKADGNYYLVETAARVAGAHLADMIFYGTGVNLWSEWARLETAIAKGVAYTLPPLKNLFAGIIVSLSKFENPDTSSFDASEIVWQLSKPFHVGFIVAAKEESKVLGLLDEFAEKIAGSFHASAPPKKTFRE